MQMTYTEIMSVAQPTLEQCRRQGALNAAKNALESAPAVKRATGRKRGKKSLRRPLMHEFSAPLVSVANTHS